MHDVLKKRTHSKFITAMARPIAETPVLYGADAQRFESIIQSTKPYSKEKKKQLLKTYEDFKRKVRILL